MKLLPYALSLNAPFSTYSEEEQETAYLWRMALGNGRIEEANVFFIRLLNAGIIPDLDAKGAVILFRLDPIAKSKT